MLRRPTVEFESQPVVGIPRNLWWYSPECLATFLGIFGDIPRNVWWHSPECLRTFLGMFGDIPQNVWGHSLEYNIPPIPRVPRIPFLAPLFLVLHIAVFKVKSWPHRRNIVCKYKLHGKPIMKWKQTFSLASDLDVEYWYWFFNVKLNFLQILIFLSFMKTFLEADAYVLQNRYS